MASRNESSIPVIDMADGNQADRLFVDGMRRAGFVSLVNHGVDAQLVREAHRCVFALMEQPVEVLLKYHHALAEETRYRAGYFTYGEEKAKGTELGWDLKHFFHLYRKGHRLAVTRPAEVPDFAPVMSDLFDALDRLSARLLAAFTLHSGTRPSVPYEDMVKGGDTLLRPLHYPNAAQLRAMIESLGRLGRLPPDTALGADGITRALSNAVRSSEHEDINLITLLVAAKEAGLQILGKDGSWIDVNNPPDAIVVNTGDMLQMATLGTFPSMTHRVVNSGLNEKGRVSLPFFVHPTPDVALVTAKQYVEHMRRVARGLEQAPSGRVFQELRELGWSKRMHLASERGLNVHLCTAGEYLQKRLKEIGNIKE